jgi:ABC-type antimicrobial peptide transport system permease subunit
METDNDAGGFSKPLIDLAGGRICGLGSVLSDWLWESLLLVSQRTREIGVRMALGAQRGAVYRLILGQAGFVAAVGIVVGLGCAVPAAALLRGLLFGVQSWDVPTPIGVAVVLGICALLASYLPARRAASVNPVEALRAE